jgi:hypothetical protein
MQQKTEGSQSRQTVKYSLSPVGLGTKNHCTGEGQQQFSSQSADRIKTNNRPNL